MPLSDDILNADQPSSSSPWADDASPTSEAWPSNPQGGSESDQPFDRPSDTPLDESKEYEPEAFKSLRPSDRNVLTEANDKSWGIHLGSELAGAVLGLAFHVAIRRPPLRQLNVRFWDAWKDIWPKFLPHERVGPGQHMAAALIGCRMAYNEDGWRVGDEVFKKDTEAFARVRRAFGAQDSKTTLKAYRLQKQEANLSSKTLARVVYHLRYLST